MGYTRRARFTRTPPTGHTIPMELYTLRLGASLSWDPEPGVPPGAAQTLLARIQDGLSAINDTSTTDPRAFILTEEGSELVLLWNRNQLVVDGDDGPRIVNPLPPPLETGSSSPRRPASSETKSLELPAGSYLFCQGRLKDSTSIAETLEWFFREAWWTKASYRDPVYLRLIREDSKTAVQVIMGT